MDQLKSGRLLMALLAASIVVQASGIIVRSKEKARTKKAHTQALQMERGKPIEFANLPPGEYKILQKFIDKTHGAYPDDVQLIVRRESDRTWLFVSKAPEEYLLSELAITFTVPARVSQDRAVFYSKILIDRLITTNP